VVQAVPSRAMADSTKRSFFIFPSSGVLNWTIKPYHTFRQRRTSLWLESFNFASTGMLFQFVVVKLQILYQTVNYGQEFSKKGRKLL
jgi:hypothetical protein